jgi:NAD(P)-dependent dehydrogenase (short-subunit alcohol dehydrogenase family)
MTNKAAIIGMTRQLAMEASTGSASTRSRRA